MIFQRGILCNSLGALLDAIVACSTFAHYSHSFTAWSVLPKVTVIFTNPSAPRILLSVTGLSFKVIGRVLNSTIGWFCWRDNLLGSVRTHVAEFDLAKASRGPRVFDMVAMVGIISICTGLPVARVFE